MKSIQLTLLSKLATVSNALDDTPTAGDFHKQAANLSLEHLLGQKEGAAAPQKSLTEYAAFCYKHDYKEDAQLFAELLRKNINGLAKDAPNLEALEIAEYHFLFTTEGIDAGSAAFLAKIEDEKKSFDIHSNRIQKLHVGFVETLHSFGLEQEAIASLRDRLAELDPIYKRRIIKSEPAEIIMTRKQIERTSWFSKISFRFSKDKSLKLYEEGMADYTAGKSDDAFQKLTMAAEMERPEAIFALGTFFQVGVGCEIDMVIARKLYKRGAILGNPDSQYHYGWVLASGLGGNTDVHSAAYWYLQAGEQGYMQAFQNLSLLYQLGLEAPGIKPLFPTATEILLMASKKGDSSALAKAIDLMKSPVKMLVPG